MFKENDKFILHSSNGMDYKIEIVSVNDFRPPEERYGCDMYDGNGVYAGDVLFFGDDFFNQECVEKVSE